MIPDLNIKIFADVASEQDIQSLSALPYIQGFTTNPSLLKKAGVQDYESFARRISAFIKDKSISFEVIADRDEEILKQARVIASWGENVFVKIPFLKTDGSDNSHLIRDLAHQGIKLNITALLTLDQIKRTLEQADSHAPIIISVFAGRIADTGRDPMPLLRHTKGLMNKLPKGELLWASSREIFSVIQAQDCGCDIITLPPDLLGKFKLWNMDLEEYSRQTVETFYKDAQSAGLQIHIPTL